MKLTPQEKKVYDYIRDHEGCTTHDITVATFIQKPCARISSMRKKGIQIVSIGKKKYPGVHAFECYALEKPLMKDRVVIEVIGNTAYKRIEKVLV
jgi:4-hydroxy-3-methylbut-2-enyl diphosphate reductase IspH